MLRRVHQLLTAPSAALLIVAVVAWPLGAFRPRTVSLSSGPRGAMWLAAAEGRAIFVSVEHTEDRRMPPREHARFTEAMAEREWTAWGFHVEGNPLRGWDARGERIAYGSWTGVAVPFWALVLVSTPLPALWLRRRVRVRRLKRAGLCPACGYDLRATPNRCPECARGVTSVVRPLTAEPPAR